MIRCTERILTTHTGSLPSPPGVVELLLAEEEDLGARAGELETAVAAATEHTRPVPLGTACWS